MPIRPTAGRVALAAVTALLALGAPAAQASDPYLLVGYDFQDTFAPSFGGSPLTSVVSPQADPARQTDDVVFGTDPSLPATGNGGERRVAQVDAGEGLRLPLDVDDLGDFSVSVHLKLHGDSDYYRRLLDFSDGESDGGLYTYDGDLEWYDPDSDLAGTGGQVPFGEWVTLTLTRSTATDEHGGTVHPLDVYLNGEPALSLPDSNVPGGGESLRLLIDDAHADEHTAGQIARVRVFDGIVDPAALSPLDDGSPYRLSLDDEVSDEAGDQWVGPRSTGTILDDGTGPVDVSATLLSAGEEVDTIAPHLWPAWNAGAESVATPFGLDERFGEQSGDEVVISATDALGFTSSFAYKYDNVGPAGLSVTGPARTSDRTPLIQGTAVVGPRDRDIVFALVCKGAACDPNDETDVVGFLQAPVSGGTWSSDLIFRAGSFLRDGLPGPVGDLPLGQYSVLAWQDDALGNWSEAGGSFEVVEEQPATTVPQPPVQPPAQSPVVPPAPPRVVTPSLAPQEIAQRLMASALRRFRTQRIRTFVKKGATVSFQAPAAGTAIVQVYDGSAPKAIAAARRSSVKKPIAVGRRVFTAPGKGAVKVKLTSRGKAALRRKRSARLTIRTVFVTRGGMPVAADRRVTLKK